MGKFRFYLSLITAKTVYTGMRITKLSSGTSVIGMLVLKLCPDFLKYANKYITKSKLNITGTNGKTTTSGLITHLIGKSVINNSMGANMLTGVVNALALGINPFKPANYSVLESDEAYLEKIYDKFDADYLLVTNLFRDQLDRYGELATTKKLIQKGIDKKPDIQLVLNADDPLVATFASQNKPPIFYGVENVYNADNKTTAVEEAFNCPNCGKALNYERKFFAQQGHYYCECGYKRVKPKYKADVTLHKTHSVLNINGVEYRVPLVGLFNAYNALGAIALALELGIPDIQKNLETFKVAFGRSEVKHINGKRTLIQLIKNPIGANEVLKTVDLDSNILIIINDNYADGRDVSWLWDTEFEKINEAKKEIVVSGIRANDMALRLKYAGCKNVKIIPEIKTAVEYIGKNAEDNITILPTYTALLKINKFNDIIKP
ncbi:MAG: MurT ligase domain-containing protein [Candidatus Gastranaerophilales bacterium]|nr:MurT ligase domain-containing protein [Candidatus Gastranaerophilales bacterium]MCM1072464.1 MurT ligase domain-containing protein [Bacteroides sp.]